MKIKQTIILLVVLAVIILAIAYLNNGKTGPGNSVSTSVDVALPVEDIVPVATATAPSATTSVPVVSKQASLNAERIAKKAKDYPRAKEISNPSGFVNTPLLPSGQASPITLSQYVGKKVIVLDIMTYSCINCIRTFPYLVDWYKKYEDKGLVIIGIHTPEFDFEKNIDNVAAAMKKYGITFPVVLDNDYGTWKAYGNLYWPRKYIIDIDGFIRADHIGEGGYDETEKLIQNLLKERADVLGLKVDVAMPVTEGALEEGAIGQSPETYFGSARNEYFGNPSTTLGIGESGEGTFTVPDQTPRNKFYLEGTWKIMSDHAENVSMPAHIVYPFAAKKVFLVAAADSPIEVDIAIDGKTAGAVTVKEAQLYDIYSGDTFGVHTLELLPHSKGLKVFTFTFGN